VANRGQEVAEERAEKHFARSAVRSIRVDGPTTKYTREDRAHGRAVRGWLCAGGGRAGVVGRGEGGGGSG